MESKHICKICNRSFMSGKSMGGHMRSHFAKLPVQPKASSSHPSELVMAPKPITFSPNSGSSTDFLNLNLGFVHGSQAYFASSPSWAAGMAFGVRASARKRSKRIPHFYGKVSTRLNAPHHSARSGNFSSSDTLISENDAAHILMMLSRDIWLENENQLQVNNISDSDVDAFADSENDDEESSESMDLNLFGRRCEICKKVFKSYQALGGHMRNHKRPVTRPAPVLVKKEFQCEICFKVFESGQALGGHKKAHFATVKKMTVGIDSPKNKLPVIQIDSDSELDSGFRPVSTWTSESDEPSTDTYYNAK